MRRLPKFDPRLEPLVRTLAKALGRLDEEQGLVGRRNARRAVSKAKRDLQAKVDQIWPAMRRRRRLGPRKTPHQRVVVLRNKGWKDVHSFAMASKLAAAKIAVHRIGGPGAVVTMAPGWAVEIAKNAPKKLTLAKKSVRERKAILTEIALKTGETK